MLTLRSATLAFGDRHLFSGLDLHVGRGQLVGISGESGCGKTSLLRAVLGFVPLTAGTVEVCDFPLDVAHIHDIRRQTAYVPQELQPPAEKGRDLIHLTHHLDANRSAVTAPDAHPSGSRPSPSVSLSVPSGSRPISEAVASAATVSQLLKSLALSPSLLDLDAAKLSGGQRQRLLLAAALSLPKPLLLLDEPTSALDEDSTQRVALALLRACHEEGRAALVVSHDPILLSFCDQVIHL